MDRCLPCVIWKRVTWKTGEAEATTATAAVVVTGAEGVDDGPESTGGQTFGIALAVMTACWGGVYILNAKAARNK